jgi:hypothetical protein
VETNFGSTPLEHVKVCLVEARKKAEAGDEPGARNFLSSVDFNRRSGKVLLPPEMLQEVQEIRRLANRNAFYENVSRAGQFAERGEIGAMHGILAEARSNARLAAMVITPEQEKHLEQIEQRAYINAIPARLADAAEQARVGHVAHVEGCIRVIHECAKFVGIPVSDEIQEELGQLLRAARVACITNNLGDALKSASQRDFDKAYSLLSLAGWHAQQGKLSFNEHQEAQYLSVVKLLIEGNYCI